MLKAVLGNWMKSEAKCKLKGFCSVKQSLFGMHKDGKFILEVHEEDIK